MPNLENLKKQAKQHLRWHRVRYHPVAVPIRAMLPRYHGLTDKGVLDSPFRLSDAQELVARSAGFESWGALRQGIAAMTDPSPAPGQVPVILSAEPQLFVRDVPAACAFYAGTLGFRVAFMFGDPPYYGQVARGGARLNLRHLDAPAPVPAQQDRDAFLAATVTVDGIKALFLECQAAGAAFAQALRREPWGAWTFIVRDPDSNLILFAGRAE